MANGYKNQSSRLYSRKGCVHDTSEGFEDPKDAEKLGKLKESIYGLKQASWSQKFWFDENVKEFDFIRCKEDPWVYKSLVGVR